ncbi:hypothetical protein G6L08_22605 [Agrobacterium rhizogenes]|nr:hypothetical protein [Rhizobium rhizogenes]
MPLIEFLGYTASEQATRVEKYSKILQDLPYAHHTIFCVSESSSIIAVKGKHKPFLRISSRYKERISDMLEMLGEHEDIEFSIIEYAESQVANSK